MKAERNLKQVDGQRIYRTALYLRLSREDGDRGESDSIANQRKLLQDYLKGKSEFRLTGEYVDDGWSGSNFDRPGWKRLYQALERGAVNCIIVKDLSRFGRNYIEVGRYLQMLFPMMGVRLLAVNDGYDSLNDWREGDALLVPMKNLINDLYCQDISLKVATQLAALRKRGECVSAFAPYGYQKSPHNRRQLVVDGDAAANVQQIFQWKLEGYSNRGIADRLNRQGVLSPYEYQTAHGNHVPGNFKRHDRATWSSGSVYSVLHNECYTGTMVQGKWKKRSYRSKELTLLPKEEWTRVENTHEAIVDTTLFTMVQEVMKRETRTAGGKNRVHLLSGFLFCGACGRQMTMQSSYYKGKKYSYYTCKDCRDGGRKTKRISEQKACAAILAAIREMAETAAQVEALAAKVGPLPEQGTLVQKFDGQLVQLQDELERYSTLKGGLYQDYTSGLLSKEEYRDYAQLYSDRIKRAKESLRAVAEERWQLISACREASWIADFKPCRNLPSLTRPVLARLVERVLIYEGGRMEIYFRGANAIEATLDAYGYERRANRDGRKAV
ncbi:MAG: recombinase family protein [Clostridiales bacterium]|nr:recombinase family protein [Clostridiales bacterium]